MQIISFTTSVVGDALSFHISSIVNLVVNDNSLFLEVL